MFDLNNFRNDAAAMSLIRLFACNKISEIEANGSLIRDLFETIPGVDTNGTVQETIENILMERGYTKFYCNLKELKDPIEKILEKNPTEPEQVKDILTFLEALKRLPQEQQYKKKLYREMIQAAIDHKGLWAANAAALNKYKDGLCMIDEWVDFFLSYTNRDQPEVNNSFDGILKKTFTRKEWDDNVEELNMLAKLIVRYLRQMGGLNISFFDQQSMVCGDNIEEKVNVFCERTFAFVQLIQQQVITDTFGAKRNWCYHEYKVFKDNNPKKEKGLYFFKMYNVSGDINEVLQAAPSEQGWQDWLTNAIGAKKYEEIKKETDIDTLRAKCKMVANEIRNVRNGMITKYLESIN